MTEQQSPSRSRELTLLLTDIEGSTEIWDADRDRAFAAIERHNEICAKAVAAHSGRLIMSRGEGDSTFSVFEAPTEAVSCALTIASSLASEPWPEDATIRTRAALHTGTIEDLGDNVFGPPINRAARLRSLAHGGQTVMSAVTANLVRDRLPLGISLRDLGVHGLRGLSRPERIFQLCDPALPCDFPPLNSIDALRHNIPAELTSFIGRQEEIAATVADLDRERMVTLTGVGGTGKSRLAIRVGQEVVPLFDAGVWFIEVGPLRKDTQLAPAIASTLRIRETPGEDLLDTVVRKLRTKKLLLILDGCEHLVDACARAAAKILARCPEVKVLTTSRQSLGLIGEHVQILAPLPLPSKISSVDLESALKIESIGLFVERLGSKQGDFLLSEPDLRDIAQICMQVDGIPLAIELAASRAAILGVSNTLARLTDRFALLTGGDRGSHQETLRATIDWSTDLLDEAEQRLYAQLGVFVGRFTLGDVEAVCDVNDAIDHIQRLTEKSLVNAEAGEFWLLETIRAHALARLEADGDDANRVRDRHMSHYEQRAIEWGSQVHTAASDIEQAKDQIAAAIEHAIRHEVKVAVRMVAALWPYWIWRGDLRDGSTWAERALAGLNSEDELLRASALRAAGSLAVEQGMFDAGTRRLEEALKIYQSQGDLEGEAWLYNALGVVAARLGDHHYAMEMHLSALQGFRDAANSLGVAVVLGNTGVALQHLGRFEEAKTYLNESIELGRRIGHDASVAGAMVALGHVSLQEGSFEDAETRLVSGLRMCLDAGVRTYQASGLEGLAVVAMSRGESARALELVTLADAIRVETGQAAHNDEIAVRGRIIAQAEARGFSIHLPGEFSHAIPLDQVLDSLLR